MTTNADAKVKISLDATAAKAILDGIEAKIKEMKGLAGQAAPGQLAGSLLKRKEREDDGERQAGRKRDREKEKKAQGIDAKTNLPLSTLDPVKIGLAAVGLAPVVGPTVRAGAEIGLDISDYGVIAESLFEGMGVKIPDAIKDGINTVSNSLLKVKAFGESFKPALDSTMKVARAQSVTGELNFAGLPALMGQAYDVNYAQVALEKKMRQMTLSELGRGVGSGFMDFFQSRLSR